jgi:invasion protein IalB
VPLRRSSERMDRELNTPARKSPRTGHGSFILAAAISAMMVFPVAAQQSDAPAAAPAQGAAAAAVPMQSWVKTCDTNKKTNQELCILSEEIRADSGTFIASISLRQITGEKKTSLLATVPLGMSIKPGLKLQVDNANPISLVYGICDVHSCFGVGEVDDSFITSMKGGKQLVLTTFSQQGKPVVFSMPLAGFGTVVAGKGLSPTDFQKFMQTRANEFRTRADQARQALLKGERQDNPPQ